MYLCVRVCVHVHVCVCVCACVCTSMYEYAFLSEFNEEKLNRQYTRLFSSM